MLLALASVVFLGSESLWTRNHYFTVSDLRLPFSSPPTTRRVTVEVFIFSEEVEYTPELLQSCDVQWRADVYTRYSSLHVLSSVPFGRL
jgi:hypothetical protein